jgi:Tol biopolymer transport system component
MWPMYLPDGESYVYVSPIGDGDYAGGGFWIVAADGTTRQVADVPARIWAADLSPDGTEIAYFSGENYSGLYVVDVATGESTKVSETTSSSDGPIVHWLDNHTSSSPRETPWSHREAKEDGARCARRGGTCRLGAHKRSTCTRVR